jgi:putative ABC transport system ATP-binding protein
MSIEHSQAQDVVGTTSLGQSPIVRAIGLTKVFGEGEAAVVALDDVTVDFFQGQLTAVMGPSGSGKSTLMNCLAALDTPTSGRALIGDTDIAGLNDKQLTILRRDRIGFVFQAYNLLPTLTALENIELPQRLAGRRPERDWQDMVIDTLGLRERLSHRPAELSGGQQQRVAVARALVGRPDIVFADEPTGNLDSASGEQLLSLIQRSSSQLGQTIVMVTHDPAAAAYAERVVFLADGRIVEELMAPTAGAVLERMKILAAA